MALPLLCRILALILAGQYSLLAAAVGTLIDETETFGTLLGVKEAVDGSSMSASSGLVGMYMALYTCRATQVVHIRVRRLCGLFKVNRSALESYPVGW